jgi:acetyltransferase-like isoleucine patch superfamily enzyme
MKSVPHIPCLTVNRAGRIRIAVETVFGLIRDIVKSVYLGIIQVLTKLAFVEREFPSSISLSARLDVIPRARHHERHKLSLGKHSLIESLCVVCTWHGDVILKDGASIGIGSIVMGPVLIGEGSACSQNCFISGQTHHYEDISKNFLRQGVETEQVVIGKNVWIGANSVILPGVKIGDNSVIGAGSTIIEDIPAYSVVAGNPAKIIKQYDSKTMQWVRVCNCKPSKNQSLITDAYT